MADLADRKKPLQWLIVLFCWCFFCLTMGSAIKLGSFNVNYSSVGGYGGPYDHTVCETDPDTDVAACVKIDGQG